MISCRMRLRSVRAAVKQSRVNTTMATAKVLVDALVALLPTCNIRRLISSWCTVGSTVLAGALYASMYTCVGLC